MDLVIRQATIEDAATVLGILNEASRWLEDSGMAMWHTYELDDDHLRSGVASGQFVLASVEGNPAATLRFQLEDLLFWPDQPQDESTYIHRFAVRRQYAGKGVSAEMLQWVVDRTRELGRHYVRLDCQANRPKLRAVYERFGFRHHSDRQVGPHFVARYEYDVLDSFPSTHLRDAAP
ncbi:MAG: hypothetical protein AMXMBFR84_31960 [Candidatus Hydrogenedentota bacterium]